MGKGKKEKDKSSGKPPQSPEEAKVSTVSQDRYSDSEAYVHVRPVSGHVRNEDSSVSVDEAYKTGSRQTTDRCVHPSDKQHHTDSGVVMHSTQFSGNVLTHNVKRNSKEVEYKTSSRLETLNCNATLDEHSRVVTNNSLLSDGVPTQDAKGNSEEAMYEASSRPETLNCDVMVDEHPRVVMDNSLLSDDVPTQDTKGNSEEAVYEASSRPKTPSRDAMVDEHTHTSADTLSSCSDLIYGMEFVSRTVMRERPPIQRYFEQWSDNDDSGHDESDFRPFSCNAEDNVQPIIGSIV